MHMVFYKGLLMNCFGNKCSSLEDIVLTKLAVELCHRYQKLKIAIFCLPESECAGFFGRIHNVIPAEKVCGENWVELIEKLANDVSEIIPLHCLKPKLVTRIWTIALAWFIWVKQHEKMFELPLQICSNFLTPDDWTVQGKINERNIAERLVQDQNIHVFQRYRIACTYFLESFIPDLWAQIYGNNEQQMFFCAAEDPNEIEEHELVKLWSYQMVGKVEYLICNKNFWQYGLFQAVETGLLEAVIYCWNKLRDMDKKKIGPQAAFIAIDYWLHSKKCNCTINLIHEFILFPPTMHYSSILCFLLSQMLQEDLVSFFREAFKDEHYSCVLDCFLQYPYQDFFMPIISQLWGVLPEEIYGEQLLSLVCMYTNKKENGYYRKLNEYYDYQGLLLTLWNQTPKYYKCYIFRDSEGMGKDFLLELLKRKPFDSKAMAIFQYILKQAIGEVKDFFSIFEDIFDGIIEESGFKFFCCVIKEFLSEDAVRDFIKTLIFSCAGMCVCFAAICDGEDEAYAKELLDCLKLSAEEAAEYKYAVIFEEDNIFLSGDLVLLDKMDLLERIMRWCLPDEEIQRQFKTTLANSEGMRICCSLLKDLKWEKLEQFLTWSFSSEEDIEQFKQRLFLIDGIDIHFSLISESHWQEADLFFKWCRLSQKAIDKLKKDTLFSDACTEEFLLMLCDLEQECFLKNGGKWESISLYLRWGLSNEETVLSFKKEILQQWNVVQDEIDQENLDSFNEVIKDRLCELENER